jgi:glycosyltransferase involved in cell wall biosynthesis
VPEAVDLEPAASLPPRACAPATLDLVSLGRVVPSKRLEHAIEAVALLVRKRLPARLAVIGRATPSYQDRLARLAARLGIGDRITFHGAIDDDEKRRLLAGAFALLGTSVREGWGLMVTEANAVGVPAVVYDVPGLRDSTRHGETGMLCEAGSPGDLARGVETLWRDPALYHRVRERAWLEAKDRSWDDAGRTVEAFFQAVAGRAC